jgi:hypothetical protein
MMARTQITLDPETQKRAKWRAAQLGISFAEYVRRLLIRDLDDAPRSADVATLFDLGRSEGSDIAREKDPMIGDAVAARPRRPGVR